MAGLPAAVNTASGSLGSLEKISHDGRTAIPTVTAVTNSADALGGIRHARTHLMRTTPHRLKFRRHAGAVPVVRARAAPSQGDPRWFLSRHRW